MTDRRRVQLAETERTLLRLRESAGLYQALVRDGVIAAEKQPAVLMGTWMMILGYTEFYVDGILDSLFDRASTQLSDGAKFVMGKEAAKSHGTWDARKEALTKVFGIRVGNFPSWQAFDGAIWVRNSIAHGSGGLSRMQKRTEATKAEALGVALIDHRLYLRDESVALCVNACCAFVEELDDAAGPLI